MAHRSLTSLFEEVNGSENGLNPATAPELLREIRAYGDGVLETCHDIGKKKI